MAFSFRDFVSLGRPQWRGQTSLAKALFFLLLGSPDTHTRIRNTHVLNVVEQLPLPPQAKVLDAGCGRGVSLFWLARRHPEWQLTGVELDPELIGSCRRAAERGDWSNLSFVDGTIMSLADEAAYNLVLCIDVLEHIPDDVGLLWRIRGALKPGGHLVLHVPRRRQEQWRLFPAFRQHEFDGHVRNEYVQSELCQRLAQAGLRVTELRHTIGRWGEASFELNSLAWRRPLLRYFLSLLTYPLAIPMGYIDTCQRQTNGNSFLVVATPC